MHLLDRRIYCKLRPVHLTGVNTTVMSQIYLVRHGQASFGAEDYDCLSELGVKQSQRLGAWWARCGESFARVAQGPMRRHRQTAVACLDAMGTSLSADEWLVLPGLAEYDHQEVLARFHPELCDNAAVKAFLAASDHPRREFQRTFAAAVQRWTSGDYDEEYRETWQAFRARCLGALQALLALAQESSRPIVAFTSGGPISVMCQHLLGSPDARAAELSYVLANASVTRLGVRSAHPILCGFNCFAHLEAGADPSVDSLVTYR